MTSDDGNDPLIGTKIGPCRIEKRLAAGGMGVVYRAHHSPSAGDVAVKILAPSLAADQEYVTRFFREAGAAGQIDHPNVVRVIDVGKHEDKYYLIMEYVAGETLDQTVDRERRLGLERATRLIREVTSGLAAAHRAGIIHRDVKPGNIIVSRDGKPHLTDFGLARHTETRKGLTVEGTFLGTPEYASPEQVEGRRLDHRTDLYSLGITYYHLMAGSLPFMGESPMEIAIKRTKDEPRPLEHALPAADLRAAAITAKLLKMDVAQRYQSATDLIRDLDAILTGQQPQVAKSTRRLPAPASVSVGSQRAMRGLVFWALVVGGTALAFFSGAIAERGGSWTAADPARAARFLFAGAAVLAAGGAAFIYRREFSSTGRLLSLILLSLLLPLGALAAGIWVERGPAEGTVMGSLAALGRHATDPVNVLGFGLLGIVLSALIGFEHEVGGSRILLSRIVVLGGFALCYTFGAMRAGWSLPFVNFLRDAELALPLGTGALVLAFFGMLMLTGFDYGARARYFGLLFALLAAFSLFAFAALVGQPDWKDWTGMLGRPFAESARSFGRSGTAIVGVLMVGAVLRLVVATGMRRQDHFYRKR